MSDWTLMPDIDPAAAACFADLDAVFALEGKIVSLDPITTTILLEHAGRRYYVKRYSGTGSISMRDIFGSPRVRLEWENLQHFTDWQIPTARLVAYGMERKHGRFVRGALITAEIPGTVDLRRLAKQGDPRLKSRRWRDAVLSQVAAIARRMHDHGFTHGDLKWRNLLVDHDDRIYLIDCPSGSFWQPPLLARRILKDLACLDKFARHYLSRTQRLRFYLHYVRKTKLDAKDKQRLGKIVHYFDGRDEDLATAATLRAAGRAPLQRQDVALTDGTLLTIKRWLRILPGKRITCECNWHGQTVIAKLFIAERGSERHWQRECRGAGVLAEQSLPTPDLLACGQMEGGGHYVLYRFLENARAPEKTQNDLAAVFAQLGSLHERGLIHDDAHLDNFLLQGSRLYIIDGAAIRTARNDRDCLGNLALMLAQLQPDTEINLRPALLNAYRETRTAVTLDPIALDAAITLARQHRLTDYLEKTLRNCTLFKVAKQTDLFFAVVRTEAKWLAPVLRDPDAWMTKGTLLKRGTTATLARVDVDGRPLVIKRYNIKGAGHALTRFWRPSRAWHAWREAHRLSFLGIATPRPLALIEHRFGPFRGRAWLVTEFRPGKRLSEHLADYLDTPPADALQAIDNLFRQLASQRITHGDLKAANLLWHDGKISLVDLDATEQHGSTAAYQRAWRKDRNRFLRNWPESSAVHSILSATLPR